MRVTLNTGELSAVNRDRSKTAYVKIEDVLVLEDRKRVARYLGQIRRDQQGRPSYDRKSKSTKRQARRYVQTSSLTWPQPKRRSASSARQS